MTSYSYPTSAMCGDYLRAAAGFVPPAAILVTLPVGMVAAIVLAGFAALFAVFGARTLFRHGTRFEMTRSALLASGLRRTSIAWCELDSMRLAYYSTRRDRRDGWMQLELRSGWKKIRLDSRIDGFAALVGFIRAVTGVSFRVRPRSTVALVGESGSGKSVVSQTILRILPRSGVITRGE